MLFNLFRKTATPPKSGSREPKGLVQESLSLQAAGALGQAALIGALVLHLGASGLLFAPWPGQHSSIEVYPVDFVVQASFERSSPGENQIAALVKGLEDLPQADLAASDQEALPADSEPPQVPPLKPVRRIQLPEVPPDPLLSVVGQGAAETVYLGHVSRRLLAAQHARPTATPLPGKVTIGFVVTASGQVEASWIAAGSGNGALNRAALAILQQAAPFEPLPPELGKSQLVVTQALTFSSP